MKEIERWKTEMPTEEEMRPKDKYTIFDRKEKRYRKGIHSKWISLISYGQCTIDVVGSRFCEALGMDGRKDGVAVEL